MFFLRFLRFVGWMSEIEFSLSDQVSGLWISEVDDDIELGGPNLSFPEPVVECGCRSHDQEGSVILFFMVKIVEKTECLNCFSESHFICQNDIVAFGKAITQPFEAVNLEFVESATVYVQRLIWINFGIYLVRLAFPSLFFFLLQLSWISKKFFINFHRKKIDQLVFKL